MLRPFFRFFLFFKTTFFRPPNNRFKYFIDVPYVKFGGIVMSVRLSKLFGMDIYDSEAGYKGKVYEIIINLEKGKLETLTTEPLKVKTKSDAKKILTEKSIPYRNVKSVKDIIIVSSRDVPVEEDVKEEAPTPASIYTRSYYKR